MHLFLNSCRESACRCTLFIRSIRHLHQDKPRSQTHRKERERNEELCVTPTHPSTFAECVIRDLCGRVQRTDKIHPQSGDRRENANLAMTTLSERIHHRENGILAGINVCGEDEIIQLENRKETQKTSEYFLEQASAGVTIPTPAITRSN